jgi:endonuclease/exonuclease/phosphatase family metal-dependent hydrolase
MRVVTWNVGEVYWPWQGNQLKDVDTGCVRDVLRELDADVVLLQELLHEGQLHALAGDDYAGEIARGCGYDRHVGVLAKKAYAPTFVDHVLSPTKRGAVEAQLSVGGRLVRAVSLHFDVFARPRRLLQVQRAAQILASDAALTIAGGDFNYDPTVSERLGYEDDRRAEAAITRVVRDVASESGPTLIGLLRVDRLLANGPLLGHTRAFTSPRRTPLGDHAPLVCDIALNVRAT